MSEEQEKESKLTWEVRASTQARRKERTIFDLEVSPIKAAITEGNR